VLNPKVALFFIAFLPQFIDSAVRNTLLPFLLLGVTFITTGMIWCLLLATFAASIFSRLKNNTAVSNYVNKVCGLTLIALGIKVAFTSRR
jgi:threonine/homoserine/homoserine lactone efflux protein